MCKSLEDLQSIKFIWHNLYMHGCKEACLWPCTCSQTNINQVQTRSPVSTLILHCISSHLSCQNRQAALAHISPTWCFLIRHQHRQRKRLWTSVSAHTFSTSENFGPGLLSSQLSFKMHFHVVLESLPRLLFAL